MKALVLSGGGCKGAFQIGVLRYLLDNEPNLDYDIYAGISVGALNASLLSSDKLEVSLKELENIWLNKIIGNKSIWKHHLLWYLLFGIILIVLFVCCAFLSFILEFSKILTITFVAFALTSFYVPYFAIKKSKSIYKTDPLRKIIEKYLDLDKLRKNAKKLIVGAVSYETGEYKTATKDDKNIIDWIMASSAFPVFFPMVEIEGEHWTDGGVQNTVPLADVLKLSADKIDIILADPLENGISYDVDILSQVERVVGLMSNEILNNDIVMCKSSGNIRVFMPKYGFNVNSLSFKPEKIKEMYDDGKNGPQQIDLNI